MESPPDRASEPLAPENPSPASTSAARRRERLRVAGAVGLPVVVLLVAQFRVAGSIVQRADELGVLLSESHAAASLLERHIGYGGLIHHFKNYVLRPGEERYRRAALADASASLELVATLERRAASLGIAGRLERTREMIEHYSTELARVRAFADEGLGSRAIDARVRFDDEHALRESEALLARLGAEVDARLVALRRQGRHVTLLGTLGTIGLGALAVGLVSWRSRRYLATISRVNAHLEASNERLRSANTALGQFAGIVSHDLKTPLRHIGFFSELIAEDVDDHEAIERHLDDIHGAVTRMDAIIASLLDFTRTGFAHPELETIELDAFLESVRDTFAPELADGGARLDIDVSGTVRIDPTLMTRVFENLVGNSLKYVADGESARVLVRTEPSDRGTLVSITDEGIGIDPAHAERVFEPLERLHGVTSGYEGVGIGLSLARSIVESHGGRLWLDTEHRGGTRMLLALPDPAEAELERAA